MTAEIQSRVGTGSAILNGNDGLRVVGLHVVKGDCEMYLSLNRADVLTAVETECRVRIVAADAIVIDRAGVRAEPVDPGEPWPITTVPAETYRHVEATSEYAPNADPEWHRSAAVRHAVMAEYLDAHPPVPPVDETDVEALGDLIRQYGDGFPADVARRLLATGRVSVRHE